MTYIIKRKLRAALGDNVDNAEFASLLQHTQQNIVNVENTNPFQEIVERLQVKTRFRKPYGTDKYDSSPSENWQFELGVPWTIYGQLFFSPILGNIVYVIDRGKTNFWSYNLSTKTWTQLSNVGYVTATGGSGWGEIDRALAVSPDGTKLACVSDATNNHRGGKRIEVYTIATDTWVASSQVQNMDDEIPTSNPTVVAGLVWADEGTIWAWAAEAKTGLKDYARCIKYTISGDTFTIYSALLNGGLTHSSPRSAAINAAGTIIYGTVMGATLRNWYKYTIATDSYAAGTILTDGYTFAWATSRDKLWYYKDSNIRQGYIDTADDSENHDQFTENVGRSGSQGNYFGVNDAGTIAIAYAKNTNPYCMSSKYKSREGTEWVEGEHEHFFSETNVERTNITTFDFDVDDNAILINDNKILALLGLRK